MLDRYAPCSDTLIGRDNAVAAQGDHQFELVRIRRASATRNVQDMVKCYRDMKFRDGKTSPDSVSSIPEELAESLHGTK